MTNIYISFVAQNNCDDNRSMQENVTHALILPEHLRSCSDDAASEEACRESCKQERCLGCVIQPKNALKAPSGPTLMGKQF